MKIDMKDIYQSCNRAARDLAGVNMVWAAILAYEPIVRRAR